MSRPTAYIDLPEALYALVPELETLPLDDEPLADCSRCVRVAEHYGGNPSKPWAFDPTVHCCTFQPAMVNVLVGRALRRGGLPAETMHKRIAEKRDMTPWGLFPGQAFSDAYDANRHRFGRATELTCPYWAQGGCGIWPDRPPVCRTWFCRHARGEEGRAQWASIRFLMDRALDRLAIACVAAGRPPVEVDPVDVWEAWFVWCADWVDERGPELHTLLRNADVDEHAREMVEGAAKPHETLPDVVIPAVGEWSKDGDHLYVVGYSVFDGAHAPTTLFEFLGRLDGTRTWREALAGANAALAEPIPESVVHELFRVGAIRSPQKGDHPTDPAAPIPVG